MSIRITFALAAAIVLSSAIGAAAQVRYYDYAPGALGGIGVPPYVSYNPGATGGGSTGYNENLRHDSW